MRLRETLKGDPGSCHVLGMTNLGLIEVTRTRIGPSLAERMQASAPAPSASVEAVALAALRAVIRTAAATPAGGYRLAVAPALADTLEDRCARRLTMPPAMSGNSSWPAIRRGRQRDSRSC